MIKQEIRKVILSPYIYISIALVAVFLYIGSYGETAPDFLYLYGNSRYAGMISYIMPLFAGLAVADMYCVERKDGYYYTVLMRSDVASYCLTKIFVAALTGFVVAIMGIAVYALMCAFTVDGQLQLATAEATFTEYDQQGAVLHGLMDRLGSEHNWWGMLGMYLLLFGIYGMIWPVMSLAAAVFTNNRYVVIAFPLLFVNLLSVISVFLGLERLNPIILSGAATSIYMRAMPGDGITFEIGVAILYLLICGTIFRVGVGKKLK